MKKKVGTATYYEFSEIGEFNPIDATTNPSLVLAAVSNKEYSFLLDDAVDYTRSRLPVSPVEEQTQLALDYLVSSFFLKKPEKLLTNSLSVGSSRCANIEHNSRSSIYLR